MFKIPVEMSINHIANLCPCRLLCSVVSQGMQELGDTCLPGIVISAVPGYLQALYEPPPKPT